MSPSTERIIELDASVVGFLRHKGRISKKRPSARVFMNFGSERILPAVEYCMRVEGTRAHDKRLLYFFIS